MFGITIRGPMSPRCIGSDSELRGKSGTSNESETSDTSAVSGPVNDGGFPAADPESRREDDDTPAKEEPDDDVFDSGESPGDREESADDGSAVDDPESDGVA